MGDHPLPSPTTRSPAPVSHSTPTQSVLVQTGYPHFHALWGHVPETQTPQGGQETEACLVIRACLITKLQLL